MTRQPASLTKDIEGLGTVTVDEAAKGTSL
ncbi:hypothetical protein FBZ86_1341 [Gluconacetobacter diazotrophicus]|nr:hypothetical protein FBZ86_1341 [Gluconacetobacter diazotrophicus]